MMENPITEQIPKYYETLPIMIQEQLVSLKLKD